MATQVTQTQKVVQKNQALEILMNFTMKGKKVKLFKEGMSQFKKVLKKYSWYFNIGYLNF